MVRGDFIGGRSDIDMMAVVDDEAVVHKLREFYVNFCKRHGCGDEPENERAKNIIPFQLFIYATKELNEMDYGIYYNDFTQNHIVLYGDEVTHLIKRPHLKRAAKIFILNAIEASKNWNNPPQESMQRHLKWVKFYPAYLAIETMKATLLYHGFTDFNKHRLIENLKNIPNFKEETIANHILEEYLKNKTRGMGFDRLRQTYKQIHYLIQHLQQLCKSEINKTT
ncbi:MAG: hypothetical protein QMD13_06025 [Candidatus Bathyarchaeia archaeon]|nr:hypothetical protein [Candidatus Bathyarchaeia archaeon]